MKKVVPEFIKAKQDVLKYFGCEEDYFIRTLGGYYWTIKEDDEMYFINYYRDDEKTKESVIVKKDGEPIIIKQGDYTMILCVECVKVALIFKNDNQIKYL